MERVGKEGVITVAVRAPGKFKALQKTSDKVGSRRVWTVVTTAVQVSAEDANQLENDSCMGLHIALFSDEFRLECGSRC